jgi:hypothetical protein
MCDFDVHTMLGGVIRTRVHVYVLEKSPLSCSRTAGNIDIAKKQQVCVFAIVLEVLTSTRTSIMTR